MFSYLGGKGRACPEQLRKKILLVGSIVALILSSCAQTPGAQPDSAPGMPAVEMITILPPGKTAVFRMGSTDVELAQQSSVGRDADYTTIDEQPAHEVTLTVPFAIGKYEVTNAQFCEVMNRALIDGKAALNGDQLTDPSGDTVFVGWEQAGDPMKRQSGILARDGILEAAVGFADHPVNNVTWYGAVAFANCLSDLHGLTPAYRVSDGLWETTADGYRLPTEAEWEYAARGTERWMYAWGDTIGGQYLVSGSMRPVGFFDGSLRGGLQTASNASPFGIFDMTGNVWEWCWDWYGRIYYAESPASDPFGPTQGDDRPPYHVNQPTRVWRGGGWMADIRMGYLRVAKRWSSAPEDYFTETGFRLARTLR